MSNRGLIRRNSSIDNIKKIERSLSTELELPLNEIRKRAQSPRTSPQFTPHTSTTVSSKSSNHELLQHEEN